MSFESPNEKKANTLVVECKKDISYTSSKEVSSAIISAFCSTYITYPIEASKKLIQGQGKSFFTNIAELLKEPDLTEKQFLVKMGKYSYRGSLASSSNTILTTVFQLSAYSALQQCDVLAGNNSSIAEMIKAATSGMLAAIPATWGENIVVKQQSDKSTMYPAIKALWAQGGFKRLCRSYSLVAGRDGIYTLVMFSLIPQSQNFINSNVDDRFKYLANGSASFLIGLIGALLTQPLDTMAGIAQAKNMSPKKVFNELKLSSKGNKAFFIGMLPRLMQFNILVSLIPYLQTKSAKLFDEYLGEPVASPLGQPSNQLVCYQWKKNLSPLEKVSNEGCDFVKSFSKSFGK